MSWPEVTLNQICTTQYGFTASAQDTPIGPKFLRISDIVNSSLDWSTVPYCKIDDSLATKYRLHLGDIVIARTGNTTGFAKLIREEIEAVFASYLVRIQLDQSKASPGFVGRLLESDIYKAFVRSIKGGAAQGNANAKILTLFKFKLPPLDVQTHIAEVLSAYEDLIENNRRRIRLLEQTVRLLYKEWFVRLRFPGYEHFEVKNGVPEGWEQVPIGDVLTLQRGFDLPVGKRKRGPYPIYASTGINGYHERAKVKGPGVVTGRSGSLGTVIYIPSDFWPLNTTLWIKEFRKVSPLFAVHLLSGLHLEQYNGGAAVPTLNRNDVHRIEVLCPSKTLLELFDGYATPVYRQIEILEDQCKKLQSSRDLLLPRLMNGEIAV
jgi:type I restriction enzyme S subunit